MSTLCHVISRNASTTTPVSWVFSGTRSECKRVIRARGNHGFFRITTMSSMDKVRRKYEH